MYVRTHNKARVIFGKLVETEPPQNTSGPTPHIIQLSSSLVASPHTFHIPKIPPNRRPSINTPSPHLSLPPPHIHPSPSSPSSAPAKTRFSRPIIRRRRNGGRPSPRRLCLRRRRPLHGRRRSGAGGPRPGPGLPGRRRRAVPLRRPLRPSARVPLPLELGVCGFVFSMLFGS